MNKIDKKFSFPLRTVVFTAIITVALTGTIAYMFGYLSLKSKTITTVENSGTFAKDQSKPTLYSCGMHPWILSEEPGNCPICGMKLTPKRNEIDTVEEKGERKIAYWRAPMNPTEIYDKSGKSAMGMDLVPVYEDEIVGGVEVKIDPVTQQNMGIRMAVVEKGLLVHTIRTYGHVTYDETRITQISPKFSGWFEKLYVNFTGQIVKKGDPLFDIYSPELVTAQEEYIMAYKNLRKGVGTKDMLASVRRRLKYYDVPEKEIRAIEASGKVKKALTIRSPFKGVVLHKNAVEGGFVKAGAMVYKIADISRVWVEAHIYEYEFSRVSLGLDVQMTLPYMPGKVYMGKVAYIYPYLQRKTRDVVIRLEFENPELELKPDMYADIRIRTTPEKDGILIPSESVIRSGERNLVFVARGKGKFSPREVTLGTSLDGGKVQILKGLAPGETIVTSGQFLIDSESKLKEAVQKMLEAKTNVGKADKKSEEDFFEDMEMN